MRKISKIILSTLLMWGLFSTTVFAENETLVKNIQYITEENLIEIDKYINVIENQFIIRIPENVIVDPDLFQQVVNRIIEVNLEVTISHATIDPATKKIVVSQTSNLLLSRMVYSAHQVDNFWWGVRHIFRTNGSVDDFAHQLDNYALGFTSIAIIAGVLSMGVSTVASGLSGLYAQKMANDLRYEKTKYTKIEINITWIMVYRIIEWRD